MEPGGRWSSLADINRAGPSTPSRSRLHRSLVDIRSESTLAAEDLLDHGSLTSCGSADPTILDDDSDGAIEARDKGNDGNTVTPMSVDNSVTGDTTGKIPYTDSAEPPEERASRTSLLVFRVTAHLVHLSLRNLPQLET
jgi:hypothetical protein